MNQQDLPDYKVAYTEGGRAYGAAAPIPELKAKIHSIRDYYGFPFFSCKIALSNCFGDKQAAIRMLLQAFGRSRGVCHDDPSPLPSI